MTRDDMADYRVRYEAPLKVDFAGSEIYSCGAWCQGVSLAQAFAMLDAGKLTALGHNSPAYIHYLTEVYKLVFADREAVCRRSGIRRRPGRRPARRRLPGRAFRPDRSRPGLRRDAASPVTRVRVPR